MAYVITCPICKGSGHRVLSGPIQGLTVGVYHCVNCQGSGFVVRDPPKPPRRGIGCLFAELPSKLGLAKKQAPK